MFFETLIVETSIGNEGTANVGSALLSPSGIAASFRFFEFSKPMLTAMIRTTTVLAKAITTERGAP
jgi:hypothetical protein